MAVESTSVVKRSNAYFINPLNIVRREGWNTRFDFGLIAELAASIKVNGVLTPLRGKRIDGDKIELIDGDRRFTAVEHLRDNDKEAFAALVASGVPMILVDKHQDDTTSTYQMLIANDSKAFLPLELAAAFKRLLDSGQTVQNICDQTGHAQRHVRETLALLDASPEIKEALQKGEIGATVAKTVAAAHKGDNEAQNAILETAKAAKAGDITARKQLKHKVAALADAKAAALGKEVKLRPMKADQLEESEKRLSSILRAKAKDAGWSPTTIAAVLKATKEDPNLVVAFTLGAIMATRAAQGHKDIELDI